MTDTNEEPAVGEEDVSSRFEGEELLNGEAGNCDETCQCRMPVRVGWIENTSYDDLTDKPSINGVTIEGSRFGSYYGLPSLEDLSQKVGISSLKGAFANPAEVKLSPAAIKDYLTTLYLAIQGL